MGRVDGSAAGKGRISAIFSLTEERGSAAVKARESEKSPRATSVVKPRIMRVVKRTWQVIRTGIGVGERARALSGEVESPRRIRRGGKVDVGERAGAVSAVRPKAHRYPRLRKRQQNRILEPHQAA
ncbi:hypothetical protein C8R44DRAFT_804598 [Mycena epipterygia]|nr:hypothetical protein C8R44DRAFT_804598 [Mycena epipterygia]